MELSVASQQQSRELGVSLHSHLRTALTLAYLTLCAVSPKLAPALPATPQRARYGLLLAAAYCLGPVLALATWRALAPVFPGGAAASVGGSLLLFPPVLVHVAHGATKRIGLVLASLIGHVAVGATAGAALGRTLAQLGCAAEANGDCGLTVLAWLLVGAAGGSALGYCVHAVRQVLVTSAARP
jgi:hypothetical protein